MRAFGLYFTRTSQIGLLTEPTIQPVHQSIKKCSYCSAGRVYATIMLVLTWLNAVRFCIVFDGKETLGATLFTKVTFLPGALLFAILHTAYYVASHTGSLDQVFRQVDLTAVELSPKYRRRAKVVTIICWIFVLANISTEAYLLFTYESHYQLLLNLINTLPMSKLCFNVIKVLFFLLYLMATISWTFPQALKLISPVCT